MPISDPILAAAVLWFGASAMVTAYVDIRWRWIPNRLVVFLAAGSLVMVVGGHMAPAAFCWSVLLGCGALLAGAVLFSRGWIGGGDVKLIAGMLPWFPVSDALVFLQATLLMGGAMALLALVARGMARRGLVPRGASRDALLRPDLTLPYGVAIAGGGLWTFNFVWL